MTDFETTHAELKAQYDELQAKYTKLKNMRDDLKQVLGTEYVVTEARAMKNGIIDLRSQNEKFRAENRQLRGTYAPTFAQDFEELKKAVDTRDEKIADLTSTIYERNTKLVALAAAANTDAAQIRNQRSTISHLNDQIADLSRQLHLKSDEAKPILQMQGRIDSLLATTQNQASTIVRMRNERDEARELLEARSKVCADLIEQRGNLKADIKTIVAKLDEAQIDNRELRMEIVSHRDMRADLIRQIDDRDATIKNLIAKIEKLDDSCRIYISQFTRQQNKIDTLKAQPTRVEFLRDWAIHQPDWSMENGVDRYNKLMEALK